VNNALQHSQQRTATQSTTHCNTVATPQTHTATHLDPSGVHDGNALRNTATQCGTLRHTVTHNDTLEHSMAHCVAVCHSDTLEHTMAHCDTLQHVGRRQPAKECYRHTATYCNILQHTATHCNTQPHTRRAHRRRTRPRRATDTLQHTTTHCNTPPHTATHNTLGGHEEDGGGDGNALQHTAAH